MNIIKKIYHEVDTTIKLLKKKGLKEPPSSSSVDRQARNPIVEGLFRDWEAHG